VSVGEPSYLVVHTSEMTDKVDAQGFYELTKYIVVEFILEGISSLNLGDLWEHSILLDLGVEKAEQGFRLDFFRSLRPLRNDRGSRAIPAPHTRKAIPRYRRVIEGLAAIMVTEVTT
jgi:hypothetical protein